jgi:hypothetical protein
MQKTSVTLRVSKKHPMDKKRKYGVDFDESICVVKNYKNIRFEIA